MQIKRQFTLLSGTPAVLVRVSLWTCVCTQASQGGSAPPHSCSGCSDAAGGGLAAAGALLPTMRVQAAGGRSASSFVGCLTRAMLPRRAGGGSGGATRRAAIQHGRAAGRLPGHRVQGGRRAASARGARRGAAAKGFC